MSNPEAELAALRGVQSTWERKADPTFSYDWGKVTVICPDIERAWEQVKLAKLAFGALLQEKIDER